MAIDNARLPIGVEQGAQGGPLFKTTILIAASGDEQRIVEWDIARGEWDIGYGISNKVDLLVVIGFFRAVLGKAHAWRFRDWSDYQEPMLFFGTGDGSTTDFQLAIPYHSYQDNGTTIVRTYTRNIYVPASSPLTIKDNGSTVNPTNYDLEAGGIISFDTAPTNGHTLTWTGEFDCPVRFDVDKLPTAMIMDDIGSIRGIRIVEVLDSVT